jgi:hypothetical protein
MIQRFVSEVGIEIPISRLGGGFYMIGTRKVYAKIINEKLVVRVGGGFMDINEFIATYGPQEKDKCQRFSYEEIAELHTPI